VNLLAILERNTGTEWQPLIGGLEVAMDRGAEDEQAAEENDELATSSSKSLFDSSALLTELHLLVAQARGRVAQTVNSELVWLY